MTHAHDSLHTYHQWPANVRAHLSDPTGHGLPVTAIDRLTDADVLIRHDSLHSTGPTAADRVAGMAAAVDTAIAGTLRKLADEHIGELDAAVLVLPDGGTVSIVTRREVQAWLEGWAVRIENGAAV